MSSVSEPQAIKTCPVASALPNPPNSQTPKEAREKAPDQVETETTAQQSSPGREGVGKSTTTKATHTKATLSKKPQTYKTTASGQDDLSSAPSEEPVMKHLAKQNPDPLQEYSLEEYIAAGPIFPDPSVFGFMAPQQPAAPRPVPRYMFNQPRLLAAPPFRQTEWDKQNQAKMAHMEAANSGADFSGIYEEFQRMRDVERKRWRIWGSWTPKTPPRTLTTPFFSREQKDPVTEKISKDRAVKAFSRPAAGQPPPIPSDVRPPAVLQKTLDYIVDSILPQLPEAHSFIWDRTRSIRQDFVYQNYYGPEAIDCNERIVRIHLLSLHIMAGSGLEYSQQQELEQFNKALQTLTEIYSDVRNHGGECPNEPELRAYHLLSHFRDPELERDIQTLPDSIYRSDAVQLALRFRTIMSQNNVVERGYVNKIGAINLFVEFFRLVFDPSTPLLLAFLLETHFNEIRFYALKSLSRAYHTKGKAFSAESLRQMLGFDTLSRLTDFVSYYEIDTFEENGELLVDLCNKEKLESKYKLNSLQDKPKRAPAYSPQLDYRLRSNPVQSLVNSGFSNADLKMDKAKIEEVLRNITTRQNSSSSKPASIKKPQPKSNVLNNPNLSSVSAPNSQARAPFGQPQSTPSSFGFAQASGAPSGSGPSQAFGAPPASGTAPAFGAPPASGTTRPFGAAPASGTTRPFGAAPSSGSSQSLAATQPASGSSLNLSDFMNNKKATTSLAQTGFGKAPAPAAFDFTANNKPHVASTPSKRFGKPVSGGIAKATIPSGLQTNNTDLEKQKQKQNLKNEASENKNVLNLGALNQERHTINSLASKPPQTFLSTPAPAGPKHLKDHPNFKKAVEAVCDDLLRENVQSEVHRISKQIVKHQNRANERNRLIGAFAEELYSAFLAEQTHQAVLESVAKAQYEVNLKRRLLRKLQSVAKASHLKQEERRQRKDEVELMTFKAPSLKRRAMSPSADTSFAKRRPSSSSASSITRSNVSFENIHERQEQVQQLWQPLDLLKFVEFCSEDVRVKRENGVVALNCVMIAENWNSPYSKWINTKFALKVSEDKSHYINEVQSGGLTVTFRSLPKQNFVNEQSFRNTPFLVFECGLLEEKQIATHKTLEQKLIRDGKILSKIAQICDRFCYYKVQVLILMWDITSSGISTTRKLELLGAHVVEKSSNSVQDIKICDMSSASEDVSENLQKQLLAIGRDFTGQLSKRGIQKRAELQPKPVNAIPLAEEPTSKDVDAASTTLKAKEEEILRRARELQKRKYLSTHLNANRSGDLTNISGVMRTPNGSFANHTLINYNNSFLGNNTFLHARDASFLKSFANASVVEESTPMGSPMPRSRVGSFARPSTPLHTSLHHTSLHHGPSAQASWMGMQNRPCRRKYKNYEKSSRLLRPVTENRQICRIWIQSLGYYWSVVNETLQWG
ncbi:hypothetical protein JCM33374_g4502 [Metschnikowia sp. JCM 33374]|nr:hypothetical protein JCM33374_g4502 [Metschnikowia sp. JCM 33374]